MKKIKKGFTLLELLVVISIIGILIAVGTVAYSTAQKKGRDAKRKGDLRSIQNAMEECYALDTSYPTSVPAVGNSLTCGGETIIESFPEDPKGGSCSYHYTLSADSYTIWADLEGSSAGCDGNYDSDDFRITNLQ